MTARMGTWILKQATARSFTAVANDCGLDPSTVAEVFEDRAKPEVLAIRAKTPRVLGLDEKHIFGGFRAVRAGQSGSRASRSDFTGAPDPCWRGDGRGPR